jgi:hypothetical protein
MAISRCPYCNLPLTDEEAQAIRCPTCGKELWEEVAPSALEPDREAVAASWTLRSLWSFVGAAAILFIGAGLGWFGRAAWENETPLTRNGGVTAPHSNDAKPPPIVQAASKQPGPRRHGAQTNVRLSFAPTPVGGKEKVNSSPRHLPGQFPPPVTGARRPMDPGHEHQVAAHIPRPGEDRLLAQNFPDVRPNLGQDGWQVDVPAADTQWLSQPGGEHSIGQLENGRKVRLIGKVRALRVGRVAGGAVLDASRLDTQEINFVGPIEGGATVLLSAPSGRVQIHGRVDGHSRLQIDAPGGKVVFVKPATPGSPGTKIDGDSAVKIIAQSVELNGMLSGGGTLVEVTLTRDGHLKYRKIQGGARLHYRKADMRDPEPRLEPGTIHGGASVQRVR